MPHPSNLNYSLRSSNVVQSTLTLVTQVREMDARLFSDSSSHLKMVTQNFGKLSFKRIELELLIKKHVGFSKSIKLIWLLAPN